MKGIKRLMSFPLITASLDISISQLRELMAHNNVKAIPIIEVDEPQKVIGIITDANLYTIENNGLSVAEVMSRQLYFIEHDATAAMAASLMLDNGIHYLLVNKCERLVGIISSFDLMRMIAVGNYNSISFF